MRFLLSIIMVALLMFQSGCALTSIPGGVDDQPVPLGLLVTNVSWTDKSSPHELKGTTKVGKSEIVNLFGLFAWGDGSVGKAAEKAGISTVHQIDHSYLSILTIVRVYKTVVFGE